MWNIGNFGTKISNAPQVDVHLRGMSLMPNRSSNYSDNITMWLLNLSQSESLCWAQAECYI